MRSRSRTVLLALCALCAFAALASASASAAQPRFSEPGVKEHSRFTGTFRIPVFKDAYATWVYTTGKITGEKTVNAEITIEGGVAATGAIAVFGAVAIQGAHADLLKGLQNAARDENAFTDLWVSPPGSYNLLRTAPFTPTRQRTLERLGGIRAVRIYRGGLLDWGARRVWVIAPPLERQPHCFPHPRSSKVLSRRRRCI
jgi:hypothetical protein